MIKIKELIKKYREIISYIIVGIMTTLVSLISYFLLTKFLFDPQNPIKLQLANIVSWVLSVTFAYYANKIFVFQSRERSIKEVSKFFISRIITLIIDMAFMYIFVSLLKINHKIAKIAVQLIVQILNYVFSKFFIFVSIKKRM